MNRFQRLKRLLFCLPVATTLLLSTGCRGPWSNDWKFSDMFDLDVTPWSHDERDVEVPRRIVNTWTDAVLQQAGKKPQRGFGGRMIFYGKDNDKPVQVDGQVVIYAFDETNRAPTDNKPTRRYVFPPDQLTRHMSKSKLGPSYSFWLPWDEVGGPQTEISLIARFEPKGGPLVIGEQTKHLLPGKNGPAIGIADGMPPKLPDGIPMRPATPTLASLAQQPSASAANNQVQLASYAAAAEQQPQTAPPQRMTTTSISLPENFRLSGGGSPQTVQRGNVEVPRGAAAAPQAPPSQNRTVTVPSRTAQSGAFQFGTVSNVPPMMSPMQPMPQARQPMPQLPTTYPGLTAPPQSPLSNGLVAPLGQPSIAPPAMPSGTGQFTGPAAPMMAGQQPAPVTATGWATVNYQPVAPQAGSGTVVPQSSSGYQPQPLQAPATPAFR